MNLHPLHRLTRSLAGFAPTNRLASVSALQLLPENTCRLVRLELLACATISASKGGSRSLGPRALQSIVQNKALTDPSLLMLEDPVDGWFVESVPFVGGSYLVLPGIVSDATYIVRNLGAAISLCEVPFSNANFETCSQQLFLAVLSLSDAIVRRAGLKRGTPMTANLGEAEIAVPTLEHLSQLRRAVNFSRSDLAELLGARGTNLRALEPLVLSAEDLKLDDCTPDANPLHARPIVQIAKRYVVANPCGLLAALRHHVICLASRLGVAKELAERSHTLAWKAVVESMKRLSISKGGNLGGHAFSDRSVTAGTFGFDTDKALLVYLFSDNLAEYDEASVFGVQPPLGIEQQLRAHVESRVQTLYALANPPNDVLVLILASPLGRVGMIPFPCDAEESLYDLLVLSVPEFQVVSHLELGKELLLWKFARTRRKLHAQSEVFSLSVLDEYGAYRDCGYGNYLPASGSAALITFAPTWEGKLIREVLEQTDQHAVLSFDRKHVTEVVRAAGKDAPIYFSPTHAPQRVAFLVEAYAVPIWIVSSADPPELGILANLGDMIAYWLWQLAPFLGPWFDSAVAADRSILVVSIAASDILTGPPTGCPCSPDDILRIRAPASWPSDLAIVFTPQSIDLLDRPTNQGELVIMRRLVMGLRQIAQNGDERLLPDSAIDAMIDHIGKPAHKQKLQIARTGRDWSLASVPGVKDRPIDPCDTTEFLGELGQALRMQLGLGIGPVPSEGCNDVLKSVVKCCGQEISRIIGTLNPVGLLEWMVAHNEANVNVRAHLQSTLLQRLGCFHTPESLQGEWSQQRSDLSRTGLALRFLIEYIVATPPTGRRPMSLSVHDRLLAIANLLIQSGMDSDLVHFGIGDVRVAFSQSGALEVVASLYSMANSAFARDVSRADLAEAERWFARRERAEQGEVVTADSQELSDAWRNEFGLSIEEMRVFWEAAAAVGCTNSRVVCRMPLDEFTLRLGEEMGCDVGRLASIVRRYAIGPRERFLDPPAPFTVEDVMPWRFTRRYSYLRRPFLLVESATGCDVVVGARQLEESWKYLVSLVAGGRHQATHPTMQAWIARTRDVAADKFNDTVADRLRECGNVDVRVRVNKIGARSAVEAPPGDVDVLVARQKTRTLFVLECKNLELARTPREMADELGHLVRGSGSRKSTVAKHLLRREWAVRHLSQILSWLGLVGDTAWQVKAAIVLEPRPLISRLVVAELPIIGIEEVVNFVTG